jgi:starch synthase
VTTVSETYASELLADAHHDGLTELLTALPTPLVGIVNGVDYAVWNPATDPAIAARFDAEDRRARSRCKGALLAELELPVDIDAPVVGFVGRLAPQKGVDLLATSIPRLLRSSDARFILVGKGDPDLVTSLESLADKKPDRVRFVQNAPESLVHRVFAGVDVVAVPSRFEPCGLVQMYAQRYGALPVVRRTGGLADTVIDCDAQCETGTGFSFDEPTDEALSAAILRAIAAMSTPAWPGLVRRVMKLDRSWERPARRLEQVYQRARVRT